MGLLFISISHYSSSFPVGYESQIGMHLLDFEEWLWANNVSEEVIAQIRDAYEHRKPLDEFMYGQLMKNYRAFLIIGGMPKVVTTYLSNSDQRRCAHGKLCSLRNEQTRSQTALLRP